jgi:hypothetical protein
VHKLSPSSPLLSPEKTPEYSGREGLNLKVKVLHQQNSRERDFSPSNPADAAPSPSRLAHLVPVILEPSLGIVEERKGRVCALLNLES